MLILVPWKPLALAVGLLSGLVLIDFIGTSLVEHKDPLSIKRAAQVILEGHRDHKGVQGTRASGNLKR